MKRKNRFVSFIVLLIVASLLSACQVQSSPLNDSSEAMPVAKLQLRVEKQMMNTMDGNKLQIGGDLKHPQILHIWSSWCNTCNAEAPQIMSLIKQLPQTVDVIGVNAIQYDDRDEAWDFVSRYQWSFPQVLDEGDVLGKLFRVKSYPATIVLDRGGNVVFQEFGPLQLETLEPILTNLK